MRRSQASRDDAPEYAGDDNRRTDDRVHADAPEILAEVPVIDVVAIESHRASTREHLIGDRLGALRETLADRPGGNTGLAAAADDHRRTAFFVPQEVRRVRLHDAPRL